MSKEAMKLALEALERVNNFDDFFDLLSPELSDFIVDTVDVVKEAIALEQSVSEGTPLPDFYITEKMAESIYKLKSPDWALCISGNKYPTRHKNIPVFVGYVKTKPVEQYDMNTGRMIEVTMEEL